MSCLTEFTLVSSDKKSQLHAMEWLPDDRNIKAVLQIAHGIGEHIGRYDTFARFMANNGFAVVGNSHLGHGQSAADENDRGFFADSSGWDRAVDDLRLVYERAHNKYPELPYFLLGHSMGSFLARTFLVKHQNLLTGCIISGTGQQSPLLLDLGLLVAGIEKKLYGPRTPSARLNVLSFGAYNRRIANHRTPSDWLTRDCHIVDNFIADDACGFVPSIGLFSDLLGGIKFIGKKKNIDAMQKDLPLLFISGDQDPVGDYGAGPKKVVQLFKDAGLKDVTLKMYAGARHEVLQETNRYDVYDDILHWLQGKV